MALTKATYSMIKGATANVLDFGAVGDGVTDDAAAIQAAMDSVSAPDEPLTVVFPATSYSYAISTTLIIKNSNLHLVGLGGRAVIKYIGTGAAALPMVRAYKDVDHIRNGSPENYINVRLKNLRLDGNNLALRGLDFYGCTRKCGADECSFFASVLPLKVRDGFYSSWNNIEVHETPRSAPPGMASATYNANKYGIFLDVCHVISFRNLIIFNIGGNASNIYTAAFYIYVSEGASVKNYTIEECIQSSDRYVKDIIVVDPATTIHFDSAYIENSQASDDFINVDENCVVKFTNTYFNNIKCRDFISLTDTSQVVFDTTFGEGFDIQDRLFKSRGTNLYGVQFLGATTFAAGSTDGTNFRGDLTTYSKQGLICDSILYNANASNSFNGYEIAGYDVTISGNDILVSPGSYHINGQTVQFGRNPNNKQVLRADLNDASSWNVRISGAGTPYLERQNATKVGASHNPIIATFVTTGSGAAPISLETYNNPVTRLTGAIQGPLATTFKTNTALSGQVTLEDTGTAAYSDLLVLTLSPNASEDEGMGVVIDYFLSTAAGATKSSEIGQMFASVTQDSSGNVVASTPSKVGTSQALDAGMASMTTTFNMSVASNVVTVQVKNETSANANSVFFFSAKLLGRVRNATSFRLANNVTPAI